MEQLDGTGADHAKFPLNNVGFFLEHQYRDGKYSYETTLFSLF